MSQELKEQILKGVVTILLFTSVFFAARQAAVLVNEGEAETEERFCVVIDAGHGGDDPGKIGINGALEKEINLQVAEKLKAFLEASDVKVVMTRTTDGGLYDGAQVFYYNSSVQGKELAETIQNRMVQYLDPENHRVAKANDSYYLLKKTGKPIVIVECGFLSNGAEAEKLCDDYYQEKVAWNIHMAIMQYLNKHY